MTQLPLEALVEYDDSVDEEEDLGSGSLDAAMSSSDWTVGTLLDQLRRNRIDLSPDFQRREAWTDARKSLFIESLFIGLPIPQLVLAERKEKKGSFIVIDGKQRLISLYRFGVLKAEKASFEPLVLEGLKKKSSLNGKTFEEMSDDQTFEDDVAVFENQTIRTVVIKSWPDENYLYLVFLRLNTGSLTLSSQELRQALDPGQFALFADEFARDSEWLQKVLGRQTPDFRMRDVELLVRFLAFTQFLGQYRGNLKAFLDHTSRTLNKEWGVREDEIKALAAKCNSAIETVFAVFGDTHAFRRWTGAEYQTRFNRAIYDVMLYYFIREDVASAAKSKGEQVKAAVELLCASDTDFASAVTSTTKSMPAVFNRVSRWGTVLQEVLGIELAVPRLEKNRIVAS